MVNTTGSWCERRKERATCGTKGAIKEGGTTSVSAGSWNNDASSTQRTRTLCVGGPVAIINMGITNIIDRADANEQPHCGHHLLHAK